MFTHKPLRHKARNLRSCILGLSTLLFAASAGLIAFGCISASPDAAVDSNGNSATSGSGDSATDTGDSGNDTLVDSEIASRPISFKQDLLPIFQTHCVVCHAAGRTADRAGISLRLTETEAYEGLINQVSSQKRELIRVVPGKPNDSLLYLKVSSAEPPVGYRMPLACSALSDQDVEAIRRWIEEGASNN